MRIRTEDVAKLNPCKSFYTHPKMDLTIEQFIVLPTVTYEEKMWTIVSLFSRDKKVKLALKIMKSFAVKSNFDFDVNNQLEDLVEAINSWSKSPTQANKQLVADTSRFDFLSMLSSLGETQKDEKTKVVNIIFAIAAAIEIDDEAKATIHILSIVNSIRYVDQVEKKKEEDLNLRFAIEVANGRWQKLSIKIRGVT